jgi:hypothetical protein
LIDVGSSFNLYTTTNPAVAKLSIGW